MAYVFTKIIIHNLTRVYCEREILEKYISFLCNKPKLSSMNKSLLEQLIWHQNSTQKKTNQF